jgi:hypothetical protein
MFLNKFLNLEPFKKKKFADLIKILPLYEKADLQQVKKTIKEKQKNSSSIHLKILRSNYRVRSQSSD